MFGGIFGSFGRLGGRCGDISEPFGRICEPFGGIGKPFDGVGQSFGRLRRVRALAVGRRGCSPRVGRRAGRVDASVCSCDAWPALGPQIRTQQMTFTLGGISRRLHLIRISEGPGSARVSRAVLGVSAEDRLGNRAHGVIPAPGVRAGWFGRGRPHRHARRVCSPDRAIARTRVAGAGRRGDFPVALCLRKTNRRLESRRSD